VKILYITTTSRILTDPSVKYRCFNFAKALSKNPEILVDVVSFDVFSDLSYLYFYDVFIFHRPAYCKKLFNILDILKKYEKTYIADYDDFIFNPIVAVETSIYRNGLKTLKGTQNILENNKKAMALFNRFTVSTQPLKDNILFLKKEASVLVVGNGISDRWSNLMSYYKKNKITNKNKVIGYFSGTKSHNYDFKIAERAIERILKKDSNVTFRVVGYLEISNRYILKNVERQELVPFYQLPKLISDCSVIIAPLEKSNFNNSKSCIKFLESESLGIPCLASPIHDMLLNKDKGCVITEEHQWEEHLHKALYDDLYVSNKIKLFEKNKKQFTSEYKSKDLIEFLLKGEL